jgi:hypothetical protein
MQLPDLVDVIIFLVFALLGYISVIMFLRERLTEKQADIHVTGITVLGALILVLGLIFLYYHRRIIFYSPPKIIDIPGIN